MPVEWFKYLFLAGLFVEEVIRFPHRRRQRLAMRQKRIAASYYRPLDVALDMLAFLGMHVIPLVFVFSPWLDFANYSLPGWAGWLGLPVLVGAAWVLWRAQTDLGVNWSPTLQIMSEHKLITRGIYAYLRHPIYAAVWLTGLAQLLMLGNWIAGPACLVLFLPVFVVRVPREEQMMLNQFGEEYRAYMRSTGGVIPRLSR